MKITAHSRSQFKKELIQNATEYFARSLNLTKSKYTLYVCTMPDLRKSQNVNGLIVKTDDREITIGLDSRLPLSTLLLTLAHEMVHAKQIAKGHYITKYAKNGKLVEYWLGKKVKAEYLNRPWEIEAFKRETLMVYNLIDDVTRNTKGKKKRS